MSTVTKSSNLAIGYKTAFSSAIILSTTAIFIRYLTETYHLPALVLAFWRDGLTAISLLTFLRIRNPSLLKLRGMNLRYLIIYGFILAIFNSLWTLAVSLNGAAISTVLVYSSVPFTAILGWCFLRETLSWMKILAIFLSLIGCVLISGMIDVGDWNGNVLGMLTGILSGLSYAIYSLMGRSASQRGLNPWTTLLYTFGFAALFLLAFNILPWKIIPGAADHLIDLLWLGRSLTGWGVLFILAIGPTLLGFGLYNVSLVYLSSSVVNLIATLEPVFTMVIAYFLLNERFSGMQIIGSFLILSGIVLLRIYEGWRQRNRAKSSPVVTVE